VGKRIGAVWQVGLDNDQNYDGTFRCMPGHAEASNPTLDQAQRIAEMLDGLTLEKREILARVIWQVVNGFSKD